MKTNDKLTTLNTIESMVQDLHINESSVSVLEAISILKLREQINQLASDLYLRYR